jgi:exodeoxyribonuclease VII large subunit
VQGWLDRELAWLESVRSRPAIADPVRELDRQAEQVDALLRRARVSLDGSLARAGDDITHVRARLLALSPAATLGRGYAIVQHAGSSPAAGAVVRSAADVTDGEELTVRFAADQITVHAGGERKGSDGGGE